MGRENKKEAIASLHRERILQASEKLFSEKGYVQTTIADISKASEYSRRTIYSYFESKDEILYRIVEKGLSELKHNLEDAVNLRGDFVTRYKAICAAMRKYQNEHPCSLENVNKAKADFFDTVKLSNTVKRILSLGTEITSLLAAFIENGKESGAVRQDVVPMMTVYIWWSSITSLLSLVQTKGKFIAKQFSVSETDFLEYGFQQLINSILEVKI